MEELGFIEIRVEAKNNIIFGPLDLDISDINEILSEIESFLYPNRIEKKTRPHIAYQLEAGSARHKFILPISAVLLFSGLTQEIEKRKNIDFLDYKRAIIIDKIQKKAEERNWIFNFSSSIPTLEYLSISSDTSYYLAVPDTIELEMYLYGEIYQEGGKTPNLHIVTKEYGNLTIEASKEQLTEGEKRLYKIYGVKVIGKQNLKENKLSNLKLIEYIEYNPIFDKDLLNKIIKKASLQWKDISNVDDWLNSLRGGFYE